jgi:hypothetical protein
MRHVLILLLALLALPAIAAEATPPTEPDGQLRGRQRLIDLVADRTQYGNRSDGTSDIEYHSADGRSAYWFEDCLWRGQWWATDEMICYVYPTTSWPGPHCFTVERRGGTHWFVGVGGAVDRLEIRITANLPGNVENFPLDQEGNCELVSMLR